ncbi:coproporphyrinogen dehydrogenase HemZ [Brotaphodocola sp.]|uniref:coproporphyrinogen dehydrogenase HemZ n=1 Tax=Brotaphodocola sp. TaxID=3073577 RepID=UPI003D7D5626
MIGILLNDDAYEQDIRELMMAFFPGETFVHEYQDGLNLAVKGTLSEDRKTFDLHVISFGEPQFFAFSEMKLEPEMREERRAIEGEQPIKVDYDNRFETKNKIKRRLYLLLMERTGKQLPWGTLTGIRPTKIALTKLEAGEQENEIRREMKETYYAGNEKINLSIEIAQKERELLSGIDYRDGYSLYVGIPFCPTTCLYCSFTSYPIGRWQKKMDQYFEALFKELDYVAEKKRGCRLETIYFGGGTPTSLSPEDLDRLITKIENTFDLSHVQEFTVEAGRPDSITREKLQVLRNHGITRISINPQTMKQATLDLIGRRHTVEDVKERFAMARELGFDNINMDLIVGLPEENLEDVQATMEAVKALAPDSITVHSLAIKRAARLNTMKEVYKDLKITNTQEMIDITAKYARDLGLEPYYLYRQKNMAGNFENVGYALPGKACIYNILIMEEKQTIIACGAGTTTKRLFPEENRIERAENVKDVEQYIERIDEMIARKEKLLSM